MTDAAQFELFMRQYQNMVYSTAFRLLGREAEAEDIAQEVFLKAYERFGELSASPTAGGWLKTVTRNLSLNHLTRYRSRWRFFSEMTLDSGEDEERPPDFAAPEVHDHRLDIGDQRRLIDDALKRLSSAQRVPLVLYHFEDLSYEEIAEKLGASLSKVKTDIHRGRESLRKLLKLTLVDEDVAMSAPGAPRAAGIPMEGER